VNVKVFQVMPRILSSQFLVTLFFQDMFCCGSSLCTSVTYGFWHQFSPLPPRPLFFMWRLVIMWCWYINVAACYCSILNDGWSSVICLLRSFTSTLWILTLAIKLFGCVCVSRLSTMFYSGFWSLTTSKRILVANLFICHSLYFSLSDIKEDACLWGRSYILKSLFVEQWVSEPFFPP
jgi:hypothetical protein